MLYDIIPFLPNEIKNIIWHHISCRQKIFINKKHYYRLNPLIDTIISNIRYDCYVRDIIRNDCLYVFNILFYRNMNKWLSKRNYKYNNVIYSDYVNFLLNYAYINNATKCSNNINLQLNLSGLKKKWSKNSRIKHNKWSN